MSLFDLPRLHFAGVATTRLPTGLRNGLIDLATNTVHTHEGPFPVDRPAHDYHAYLDEHGTRYGADGRADPEGPFNALKGWNFAGNGHFAVDSEIVGVETPDGFDTGDLLVGRKVDMWGHYNEYLATTANRARVFDVDPASDLTTTLMVGQLSFGRQGRSHDVGYLVSGGVSGLAPPRWQNDRHVQGVTGHWLAGQLGRATLYQFVVPADEELRWGEEAAGSPALRLLRQLIDEGRADGLVVQFALAGMAPPAAPGPPDQWGLRGTIAPWRAGEPRTAPAGRLLVPVDDGSLRTLSLRLDAEHVTLNMITAVPVAHRLGPPLDLGDLELRTASGDRLVAVIPSRVYTASAGTSGVVTVAREAGVAAENEALVITAGGRPLLREQETVLVVDDAAVLLDYEEETEVEVSCFVRGEPAPAGAIRVRQFANPRARPLDPPGDVEIVEVATGEGRLTLRGVRPGTTCVLLAADPAELPEPGHALHDGDEAALWRARLGAIAVRVLPDHRHLDAIPQQDVGFEVLYRHIFAYYELTNTFMKSEVFSLADRFKVETHPRLIWTMCDPKNKSKTYYMPPTRDMSAPQARLLLKFLRRQHTQSPAPTLVRAEERRDGGITTRQQLITALRQAATIELAVMLQYLYAAYSVPLYGAGLDRVRSGEWTPEQLRLLCGSGGESLDNGIRGTLITVAREEMIHFLVVNNVLMACGAPFYIPDVDFTRINDRLAVPLDFALEPLSLGSVHRFIAIEQPESMIPAVGPQTGATHPYGSLSELYADIRQGLQRVPDLFMVDKGRGGGEHHLFLRRSVNDAHPDYQLEVDDLASALFAIDVVTEQGEGNILSEAVEGEPSHFDAFVGIADQLSVQPRVGRAPWSPAYPVVRNPTLRAGRATGEQVTDPEARQVMGLFNRSYHMMFQLMAQHFGERPDSSLRRSDLMNAALDIMVGAMRPLGELLVTMPSGRRGKTAGPSFELEEIPAAISRPDVARRAMSLRFDHLAKACHASQVVPERVGDNFALLADFYGRAGMA
uniref:Putative CCA synthetase n=1 Tax=Actinomadura melliaura TaxID=360723 RepID=Q0H2X4_9ACTN|nr:putative CCA synthetase [Actinomadura melliaura]